jgi:hypothetical protein
MPNTTKESKARQRARNNASGHANAGSSGVTKQVEKIDPIEWEELHDGAEHVQDWLAVITNVSVMHNRTGQVTMIVPRAYVPEVTQLMLDSQEELLILRAYIVPKPKYQPADDDAEV